jgi:hypothetical protein
MADPLSYAHNNNLYQQSSTIINNDTRESKEFRGHASESASLQTPVKGAANVLKIPGATQAIQ